MNLEIALEADEEWDSSRSWEPLVRKAVQAAIAESAFPQLAEAARSVELSVRLAGDEEVRALNAHWRGKDKPTNVLSFPMAEPYELEQADERGPAIMLGDIILAHGVCEVEAVEEELASSNTPPTWSCTARSTSSAMIMSPRRMPPKWKRAKSALSRDLGSRIPMR